MASCRPRVLPLSSMAVSAPSIRLRMNSATDPDAHVERLGGAVLPGELQAGRDGVGGDHPRAAQHGQAGGEQADDALAEDGDLVAEVDVGGVHGVERDGADAGEDAGDRVGAGWQRVADELGGGDHGLAAVAPDAPDEAADGRAGDVGRRLHHLTDLLVAPAAERVSVGVAVEEQALARCPTCG